MAIVMLDQVEFSKIPGLNFVLPVVTSDPSPTALDEGRLIYNTTENAVKYCNETPAWITLGQAGAGVAASRAILAGAGLTGGGDLSADRTITFVSATADMTVGADDVTIVSAPKWTTARTLTLSGDISGSVSFDGSAAIGLSNTAIGAGVIVDADVNASAAILTSKISGLDTALTNRALTTVDLTAGAGLTGGGTIAANRTFAVGAGTGMTVNADDIAINRTTTDTWYLQLSGGTLTNFLTLHADPSSAMHAATKQYVDLTSQGFTFKNAVRLVSTTNVASITGNLSIDGLTTAAGDRVLLAGQTTASQNGIWVAAAGAWARAADMDANGELKDGTLVAVAAGTAGADSQYICTAIGADPWVAGTSTSTWSRFSSLNDLTAGAGLLKTGNTIDVQSATADLTVQADTITVVSAPKWTTGRTITLTGDTTGVSAAFDGSGNLSFATTGVQAAKLTTPRTITLTGDVTSSGVSFDGSANISIATTAVGAGTAAKHYAGLVGSGTAVVVNHALNTRDVVVEIYRNGTPWDTVQATVERTDVNNVTLRFATSVTASAYRCVVTGK